MSSQILSWLPVFLIIPRQMAKLRGFPGDREHSQSVFLDPSSSWEDYLSQKKFSYNKSYHKNIRVVPFKALYAHPCHSQVSQGKASDRAFMGPKLIHDTASKISLIKQGMKNSQIRQTSHMDNKHRKLDLSVGDLVFQGVSFERYSEIWFEDEVITQTSWAF